MINMLDCESIQAYDVPFITYTKYNEQCDKFIFKALFICFFFLLSSICYKQQTASLDSIFIITKIKKK